MFYINKKHRTSKKRVLSRSHIPPTIAVFIAFFGLTLWNANTARKTVQEKKQQVLASYTSKTSLAIDERMKKYEEVLRSGSGLFGASDDLKRAEWKQFVQVFDLPKRYPGLQSIGFADLIKQPDLADYLVKVQADGPVNFTITPEGTRPMYVSVVYSESQIGQPITSFGYDMYSDPTRRAAMDHARDIGGAALTDPLTLVIDQKTNRQPGFIMYMPVYERGAVTTTAQDKIQSITGFVFASFRSNELLKYTDTGIDNNYGFRVYSGAINASTLYYQSATFKDAASDPNAATLTVKVPIEDKLWTVEAKLKAASIPSSERNRPASVFWGGTFLSIVAAGFIYMLLLNRIHDLAYKEERDLKEAKEELLALASHQLRTPATGVKQYIGLLRDGYAGELTAEQLEYVNKAYQSNERQLGTINEMLTVARADAGNFELNGSLFSFTDMITEIVDESRGSIKERNQVLQFVVPKNKLIIKADEKYIRMAVENIVSNATKYTGENGTITITIKKEQDHAVVVINDTGVGVSQDDYALLFLKFSRIPNELTNKVSGTGIGLYLAKAIVEASGGNITFISKVGVGSTCTITLPIAKNE